MKKFRLFLLMMLVALAMTCICGIGVTAFAEDVDSQESQVELPDSMTEKELNEYWESFKKKISDTATWTSIGAAILTIISTSGVAGYGFKKIFAVLINKADKESVKKDILDLKEHIVGEYNANHSKIAERLENTESNEQKLIAILTVFMLNCKIPDCAKAEIMAMLTDIKKYSGDIADIVAQAQESIENAQNEKMSLEPPAPELEQLLKESKMKLG